MTNHLHDDKYLNQGDVVRLDCDTQCNFMIMDGTNYQNYRHGRRFTYCGGKFVYFPATITVPHTGTWHVVIDLGGGRANIRYNLSYLTQD
ncbi:DUF1883 domain-containing protein [Acinetobacter ursingii]|uniref:DUF1883 domain-containing protein n=1 Tax=Acinetobacter ursingii TaxID=108980 RepID=UPI003AF950CF